MSDQHEPFGLQAVLRREERREEWSAESAMLSEEEALHHGATSLKRYKVHYYSGKAQKKAQKKSPDIVRALCGVWWRMVDQIKTGSLLISYMRGLAGYCG